MQASSCKYTAAENDEVSLLQVRTAATLANDKMARLGKGHGKTTTEKPSQGEADARKASKNNEKDEAILKAKEANISIEVSEMEKDITAEAEHYREMEKNITDMQNLETVEEVVRQLEKKSRCCRTGCCSGEGL